MNITIYPSTVVGEVSAPPSKSMTQRAIAAGLLANGSTIIKNPSGCKDSEASLRIATHLGANISVSLGEINIIGGSTVLDPILNCGESGLAMRMFSPISALQNKPVTFTGEGSLLKRPVQMIEEALVQLGVSFTSNSGRLPFQLKGPITGGSISIDASVSSQLLTGLIMALPCAPEDSEIKVFNLKSKPYVEMTMELLTDFGILIENQGFRQFRIPGGQFYKACNYSVEGDWSSAAFLLVAGAVMGSIEVNGLRLNSKQADIAILEVLQKAGAFLVIRGNSVQVISSSLQAFQFDASECPDLFPPLAALAAFCNGNSVISGTNRLFHKESNRADSIRIEMGKLGVRVDLIGNEMHIHGGKIHGTTINSHNDHRIAMMAAITALGATGPVTITDAGCVEKSFPDFFECLTKIGVKIES
jgi:3-phosphoshikimate 1-carboxyvinyltransferase